MKKIYQAPEILETAIVVESIIADSSKSGKVDTGSQVSGDDGGWANSKGHNAGSWGNIWGN